MFVDHGHLVPKKPCDRVSVRLVTWSSGTGDGHYSSISPSWFRTIQAIHHPGFFFTIVDAHDSWHIDCPLLWAWRTFHFQGPRSRSSHCERSAGVNFDIVVNVHRAAWSTTSISDETSTCEMVPTNSTVLCRLKISPTYMLDPNGLNNIE